MKNKGIICLCGVIAAIAAYVIITDDAPSRNKTPEFPEKSSIFSIPFENSPTESTSPLAESSIISYPKPPEESNRQYSQWYDQTSKSSEVVSYWQEESNEPESVFYTQGIYKNNPKGYPDNFMKSSAKTLEGRTIIISVFANDDHTAWTMDDRDNDIRYEMMKNMEIACNWLEEQSRSYGKDAELIFSFDGTTGLAYTAQFYEDATSQMTGELYSSESSFAENYIDTAGLVQKYQADNVIYMYFLTPPTPALPDRLHYPILQPITVTMNVLPCIQDSMMSFHRHRQWHMRCCIVSVHMIFTMLAKFRRNMWITAKKWDPMTLCSRSIWGMKSHRI